MTGSCIYCGEQLRPNSMFCFRCGQLVHTTADSPERVPAHTRASSTVTQHHTPERPGQVAPTPPQFGVQAPVPPRWSPPRLSENAPRRRADPAPSQEAAAQSTPAVPAAPVVPAAAPSAGSTVVLSFSTGDRVIVVGNAVIGRKPQSEALNSGAQSIPIDDPKRSLSRVHLLLNVDSRGATVTDPGSANGSSLERAGVTARLVEGQPTVVLPGDRLWLGDVSADLSTA